MALNKNRSEKLRACAFTCVRRAVSVKVRTGNMERRRGNAHPCNLRDSFWKIWQEIKSSLFITSYKNITWSHETRTLKRHFLGRVVERNTYIIFTDAWITPHRRDHDRLLIIIHVWLRNHIFLFNKIYTCMDTTLRWVPCTQFFHKFCGWYFVPLKLLLWAIWNSLHLTVTYWRRVIVVLFGSPFLRSLFLWACLYQQ